MRSAMAVMADEDSEIAIEIALPSSGSESGSETAQRKMSDFGVDEGIKVYLSSGRYPDRCKSKSEKRIFRRRAQQFVVNDGQLFYQRKTKGRGSLSITLATSEEQKRAFQVCKFNNASLYTTKTDQ